MCSRGDRSPDRDRNNRIYGWFIAATFALFALFDVIRIIFPNGLSSLYSLILLAACVSMLYAVWLIHTDTRKKAGRDA